MHSNPLATQITTQEGPILKRPSPNKARWISQRSTVPCSSQAPRLKECLTRARANSHAQMTGGKGIANELTPLYLAAAKAFDVPMTLPQQAIVEQWRGEVIERIRTIKGSYVRSSVYDSLLGALFPELREALPRTTGSHFLSVYQKHQQKLQPPPRELQPRGATRATMAATLAEFRHSMPSWMRSSGFLSGADLESWIEQNPESANSEGNVRHLCGPFGIQMTCAIDLTLLDQRCPKSADACGLSKR